MNIIIVEKKCGGRMTDKKYVIDNEELMKEWNWVENNKLSLDPKKITYGSNKKAFWICKKGHKWYSTISDISKGSGCPFCYIERRSKKDKE